MAKVQFGPTVQLFYSYSHKDTRYKESMETALALLRREKLLDQWSDQRILPGQKISQAIRERMDHANIMVFLLSPDFIASDECIKEWDRAGEMASSGKPLFRIPVVLRECPWLDLLGDDDVKALPADGKPISSFHDGDVAWQQVYEGIKSVVNDLRVTFIPKQDFLTDIERTDFISEHKIKLQDLFIFPRMALDTSTDNTQTFQQTIVSDQQALLNKGHALIHGHEKTGKTALARFLYLSLAKESRPVLLIDLNQTGVKPNQTFLHDVYQDQFHGDYSLWLEQNDKTLILDNVTAKPNLFSLIDLAREVFDRIIVISSSDIFYSFFIDESRLADFNQMKLEPLSHNQQERLIRKRLQLSSNGQSVTDGYVDQVEDHVNSVIISDKIVPRYPFYVLAILQTYEGYMPRNMSITSYGHCYYVLIVASLMRTGISGADDDINACFNFAENLAFEIYLHRKDGCTSDFNFEQFLKKYKERFFIRSSIVNRLKDSYYGIINEDGWFRTEYMYYFFLGKFLAQNKEVGKPAIDAMCLASHREANHLTLLFTIHHTNDNEVIDEILLRTMLTMDDVSPATLDAEETKRFADIILALPENILSADSVEKERERVRAGQDEINGEGSSAKNDSSESEEIDVVNGIYRILRNNKIIGQVLRNKHGSLERAKIEEIIEIIADGGLRLVNAVLKDENEIADLALYIKSKHPNWDTPRIILGLQYVSFIWTMVNIEQVVDAINIPEIRQAVNNVVRRNNNPAYDLVGYFSHLDSAKQLDDPEKVRLGALLKQHDDAFIRRVLSIRTQHYMNTHRSKATIVQAICPLLGVNQTPRMFRN